MKMKKILLMFMSALLIQSCMFTNSDNPSDNSRITLMDLDYDDYKEVYSLEGVPYSGIIKEELCYGVSRSIELKDGKQTAVRLMHPNKTIAAELAPTTQSPSYYNQDGDLMEYPTFVNEYYYYFVEPGNVNDRLSDENFSFFGVSFGQDYKDFYGQLKEKGFRFIDVDEMEGRFYDEAIKIKTDLNNQIVTSIGFTFKNYNQAFRDRLISDLSSKYGKYAEKNWKNIREYTWYVDNGEIILLWNKDNEYPNSGIISMYYQNSKRNIDDL